MLLAITFPNFAFSGTAMSRLKMTEQFVYVNRHDLEEECITKLEETKMLIVTGPAQSGKTSVCIEIVKEMSRRRGEWKVAIDISPNDVIDIERHGNFIVFLDEFISPTCMDKSNLEAWKRQFPRLSTCLTAQNIYLIFSLSQTVLRELGGKGYNLFQPKFAIDLTKEKWRLSYNEQYQIASEYNKRHRSLTPDEPGISNSDLEIVAKSNPFRGFLKSCYLFFDNKDNFERGISFFISVSPELHAAIRTIYINDKLQYLILVYILTDTVGVASEPIILFTEELERLNTKIPLTCHIDNARADEALSKLQEENLIVVEDSRILTFSHRHVCEATLESLFKYFPDVLLEVCDLSLIKEYGRSSHYCKDRYEECVCFPSSMSLKFAQRLYQSYDENVIEKIFEHKACTDPNFINFVLDEINKSCNKSEVNLIHAFQKARDNNRHEFIRVILHHCCSSEGNTILKLDYKYIEKYAIDAIASDDTEVLDIVFNTGAVGFVFESMIMTAIKLGKELLVDKLANHMTIKYDIFQEAFQLALRSMHRNIFAILQRKHTDMKDKKSTLNLIESLVCSENDIETVIQWFVFVAECCADVVLSDNSIRNILVRLLKESSCPASAFRRILSVLEGYSVRLSTSTLDDFINEVFTFINSREKIRSEMVSSHQSESQHQHLDSKEYEIFLLVFLLLRSNVVQSINKDMSERVLTMILQYEQRDEFSNLKQFLSSPKVSKISGREIQNIVLCHLVRKSDTDKLLCALFDVSPRSTLEEMDLIIVLPMLLRHSYQKSLEALLHQVKITEGDLQDVLRESIQTDVEIMKIIKMLNNCGTCLPISEKTIYEFLLLLLNHREDEVVKHVDMMSFSHLSRLSEKCLLLCLQNVVTDNRDHHAFLHRFVNSNRLPQLSIDSVNALVGNICKARKQFVGKYLETVITSPCIGEVQNETLHIILEIASMRTCISLSDLSFLFYCSKVCNVSDDLLCSLLRPFLYNTSFSVRFSLLFFLDSTIIMKLSPYTLCRLLEIFSTLTMTERNWYNLKVLMRHQKSEMIPSCCYMPSLIKVLKSNFDNRLVLRTATENQKMKEVSRRDLSVLLESSLVSPFDYSDTIFCLRDLMPSDGVVNFFHQLHTELSIYTKREKILSHPAPFKYREKNRYNSYSDLSSFVESSLCRLLCSSHLQDSSIREVVSLVHGMPHVIGLSRVLVEEAIHNKEKAVTTAISYLLQKEPLKFTLATKEEASLYYDLFSRGSRDLIRLIFTSNNDAIGAEQFLEELYCKCHINLRKDMHLEPVLGLLEDLNISEIHWSLAICLLKTVKNCSDVDRILNITDSVEDVSDLIEWVREPSCNDADLWNILYILESPKVRTIDKDEVVSLQYLIWHETAKHDNNIFLKEYIHFLLHSEKIPELPKEIIYDCLRISNISTNVLAEVFRSNKFIYKDYALHLNDDEDYRLQVDLSRDVVKKIKNTLSMSSVECISKEVYEELIILGLIQSCDRGDNSFLSMLIDSQKTPTLNGESITNILSIFLDLDWEMEPLPTGIIFLLERSKPSAIGTDIISKLLYRFSWYEVCDNLRILNYLTEQQTETNARLFRDSLTKVLGYLIYHDDDVDLDYHEFSRLLNLYIEKRLLSSSVCLNLLIQTDTDKSKLIDVIMSFAFKYLHEIDEKTRCECLEFLFTGASAHYFDLYIDRISSSPHFHIPSFVLLLSHLFGMHTPPDQHSTDFKCTLKGNYNLILILSIISLLNKSQSQYSNNIFTYQLHADVSDILKCDETLAAHCNTSKNLTLSFQIQKHVIACFKIHVDYREDINVVVNVSCSALTNEELIDVVLGCQSLEERNILFSIIKIWSGLDHSYVFPYSESEDRIDRKFVPVLSSPYIQHISTGYGINLMFESDLRSVHLVDVLTKSGKFCFGPEDFLQVTLKVMDGTYQISLYIALLKSEVMKSASLSVIEQCIRLCLQLDNTTSPIDLSQKGIRKRYLTLSSLLRHIYDNNLTEKTQKQLCNLVMKYWNCFGRKASDLLKCVSDRLPMPIESIEQIELFVIQLDSCWSKTFENFLERTKGRRIDKAILSKLLLSKGDQKIKYLLKRFRTSDFHVEDDQFCMITLSVVSNMCSMCSKEKKIDINLSETQKSTDESLLCIMLSRFLMQRWSSGNLGQKLALQYKECCFPISINETCLVIEIRGIPLVEIDISTSQGEIEIGVKTEFCSMVLKNDIFQAIKFMIDCSDNLNGILLFVLNALNATLTDTCTNDLLKAVVCKEIQSQMAIQDIVSEHRLIPFQSELFFDILCTNSCSELSDKAITELLNLLVQPYFDTANFLDRLLTSLHVSSLSDDTLISFISTCIATTSVPDYKYVRILLKYTKTLTKEFLYKVLRLILCSAKNLTGVIQVLDEFCAREISNEDVSILLNELTDSSEHNRQNLYYLMTNYDIGTDKVALCYLTTISEHKLSESHINIKIKDNEPFIMRNTELVLLHRLISTVSQEQNIQTSFKCHVPSLSYWREHFSHCYTLKYEITNENKDDDDESDDEDDDESKFIEMNVEVTFDTPSLTFGISIRIDPESVLYESEIFNVILRDIESSSISDLFLLIGLNTPIPGVKLTESQSELLLRNAIKKKYDRTIYVQQLLRSPLITTSSESMICDLIEYAARCNRNNYEIIKELLDKSHETLTERSYEKIMRSIIQETHGRVSDYLTLTFRYKKSLTVDLMSFFEIVESVVKREDDSTNILTQLLKHITVTDWLYNSIVRLVHVCLDSIVRDHGQDWESDLDDVDTDTDDDSETGGQDGKSNTIGTERQRMTRTEECPAEEPLIVIDGTETNEVREISLATITGSTQTQSRVTETFIGRCVHVILRSKFSLNLTRDVLSELILAIISSPCKYLVSEVVELFDMSLLAETDVLDIVFKLLDFPDGSTFVCIKRLVSDGAVKENMSLRTLMTIRDKVNSLQSDALKKGISEYLQTEFNDQV